MWRLALCLYLLAVCSATEQDVDDGDFVGWRGASFDPQSVFGSSHESGPVKLSDQPLAFVWRNFISRDEAKHIAHLAAPQLRHSLVGDNERSNEDEVIAGIETRLSNWTNLPAVHQEEIQRYDACSCSVHETEISGEHERRLPDCCSAGEIQQLLLQVLRYSPGQKYMQHVDGHGRIATTLIYLTDTQDGGETAFPATTDEHWADMSLKPEGLSPDCAEGHVAVKPEVGTALLFYSMDPGADRNESLRTIDPFSLHTGCPPNEGAIKWTATFWIHYEPFRSQSFSMQVPKKAMEDPAVCRDIGKATCSVWKGQGECERNKGYMMGDGRTFGHCGVACGSCTPCHEGDSACVTAQRTELGYLGDLSEELRHLFPDA